MGRLRDRRIAVIVGPPGQEGRLISDPLRIDFTVEQSRFSSPDKAEVEIYNLKRSTAALIEQGDERRAIQLFAGYRDSLSLLFQGEIREAKTTENDRDRITRISAADGGAEYRSGRLTQSWRGPVTSDEIIRGIGESFGVPINLPDTVETIEYTQGFSANGAARESLDKLAADLDFDWTFENGEIVVTRSDEAVKETAPLLNASTGLIGSIEVTNKGINGTCLLNTRIRPKRFVSIETEKTSGFFLVQKVTHKGSNFATEFYTEFEARNKPQ